MITISNVQYNNFNNKILYLNEQVRELTDKILYLNEQVRELTEQNNLLSLKIEEYETILEKENNNDNTEQHSVSQS